MTISELRKKIELLKADVVLERSGPTIFNQ